VTDVGVRLAVIVVILLAVAVAAASTGRRRARPLRTTRDDLPPGVHLFTSTTCATCDDARKVIASAYADGFTEIRHEDDPQSFAHHGIARVPTAIVVGPDRTAMVFEGVPRRRHLPPVPPRSTAKS
jgi:hypothetical protein